MKWISILVLSLGLLSGLSRPYAKAAELTAEQDQVLQGLRASSLQYVQQIPNFICTQTTHREQSGLDRFGVVIPGEVALTSDVIEENLTYFDHKESYEVISVNRARAQGLKHSQMMGAISTGEFGTLLQSIFLPASHTDFTWDKVANLHGRQAYVFAFHVPKEAGMHVAHRAPDQDLIAAYSGLVFADPATMKVMRVTQNVDLPRGFTIREIRRALDYSPAEIDGQTYNLPLHSSLEMKDRNFLYTNQIDFKGYHKFTVKSIIHLDPSAGPPETPAPIK